MPRYRYSGEVPVKCAGRLWEAGETAEVPIEIMHPHFQAVKAAKAPKETPDATDH
jgi:hypothetical protein